MTDQPQSNEDANKKRLEETKKRLADEKSAREKEHAEHREAMAGVKPTPTQEENDLAASGIHVSEHEHDGSPADEAAIPPTSSGHRQTRQVEAGKPAAGASYPTRSAAPKPPQ
jgi:hypothetical protein